MTDPLPVHETAYVTIGCVGETCRHWSPPTVAESVVDRSPMNGSRLAQPYILRQVSPNCARTPEYAARRYAIYDRAQAAVDAVNQSALTWRGAARKAARVWDEITAEFKSQPCPFYEPANLQETTPCPN